MRGQRGETSCGRVSVPETEYGRQLTQRRGCQLAGQPCGNVSADELAAPLAECPRIDPVMRATVIES